MGELNEPSQTLTFYVLFRNPTDYPDQIICRIQKAISGKVWVSREVYLQGYRLGEVRTQLLKLHPDLVKSGIPEEDPNIEEVWF